MRITRILYLLFVSTLFATVVLAQTRPTVTVLSINNGEKLVAGGPFTIHWFIDDRSQVERQSLFLSTDGGVTYDQPIAQDLPPEADLAVFQVPRTLETVVGMVRLVAYLKDGTTVSDDSDRPFSVIKSQAAILSITIEFSPPSAPDSPPEDIQFRVKQIGEVTADGMIINTAPTFLYQTVLSVPKAQKEGPFGVKSYRIYRDEKPEVEIRPELRTGENEPDKLKWSEITTAFPGQNFTFAVTSSFGSSESRPSTTDTTKVPVVLNLQFRNGTVTMNLANSFIATTGAVVILDGREQYPLIVDSTGLLFTVRKQEKSTPSGLKIKKVVKPGQAVSLVVKNPTGEQSVTSTLQR